MSFVLVSGAGGFIGSHLVNSLIEDGHEVRAVDVKKFNKWEQINPYAENLVADMSLLHHALEMTKGVDRAFLLAADMGGMLFIHNNRVATLHSVDITSASFRSCDMNDVKRVFQASSACVYPAYRQNDANVTSLKESDAWPADPERPYGFEKLYGEDFCHWYAAEGRLETRVARYHNVYGPFTTYQGGREKAPAAICRKVIEAKLSGVHEIEVYGDGEQTRSFMYIDDCVKGTRMIMDSEIEIPLNLGSSELVSVNQLVDIVEDIAGIKVKRNYDLTKPQGVRGRNSDNTLIQELFGWEPSITLRDGLEKTYEWVYNRVVSS